MAADLNTSSGSGSGGSGFFVYTTAGYILPTITSFISFLSSLTIVVFILRSRSNTVYHRIIFLISIFDMISSIAVSLSTLPLPPESHLIYPFKGPSFGSVLACEIQGLVYTTGFAMVLLLGTVLNIYYVCKLVYNMEDAVFRKRIEPILYAFCVAGVFIPDIFIWRQDGFNPSPYNPFCAAWNSYPHKCTLETDPKCRGASPDQVVNIAIAGLCIFFIALGALIMSMSLIIASHFRNERNIRQHLGSLKNVQGSSKLNSTQIDLLAKEQILELQHIRSTRKTVTKQSFLYILAFFFTWFWNVIESLSGNHNSVAAVRFIFQPSQGLFNLLIFMYHKSIVVKKNSNDDLTLREALTGILRSPKESSSNMLMIHNLDFIGATKFMKFLQLDTDKCGSHLASSASAVDHNHNFISDPEEKTQVAGTIKLYRQSQMVFNDVDANNDLSYAASSELKLNSLGGFFEGISFASFRGAKERQDSSLNNSMFQTNKSHRDNQSHDMSVNQC